MLELILVLMAVCYFDWKILVPFFYEKEIERKFALALLIFTNILFMFIFSAYDSFDINVAKLIAIWLGIHVTILFFGLVLKWLHKTKKVLTNPEEIPALDW